MHRTLAVPAVAAAALTGVLTFAGAASAHVTVNPSSATAGSWSKLTFRVPTESDTASTTKVAVYLPTDAGFQSVTVKPHPGWSYRVTRRGDAVAQITWRPLTPADRIHPGEFDEFDISVGPLPDSGTVAFKALQYYSDGSVVRWIDTPVAGQPEPEHPAPVLTLTPAADTTDAAAPAPAAAEAASDESPSHAPLILATIALVVAVGAFALSVLARRRG